LLITQLPQQPKVTGLEIRDAKGRVRIMTEDREDHFDLVLLDGMGKKAIVIRSYESGGGVIGLEEAQTGESIAIGDGKRGWWGLDVNGRSGIGASILARADGSAGVATHAVGQAAVEQGQSWAWLGSDPARKDAVVGVGDTSGKTQSLMYAGNHASGLSVWSEGKKLAGIACEPGKAAAWVGSDREVPVGDQLGVRAYYEDGLGATVTVFGGKDRPGVLLQDLVKQGTGIQVGLKGAATVKAGIKESGSCIVRIVDETGKAIVDLPEKK
jgi:hypothetical protein